MKWIRVNEAADYLGITCDKLYRLCDMSKLKAMQGKAWNQAIRFRQSGPHSPIYFQAAWLDEWIDNQTIEPVEAAKGKKERALPLSGFAAE